jgi:hypothetical protein
MRATQTRSVDKRTLITVTFERASPDADGITVEAVFEAEYPVGLRVQSAVVLSPLSCTRVDTREPVTLTVEERRQVLAEAAEKAAE